jgi:anti-anti-sigma regulatory factor
MSAALSEVSLASLGSFEAGVEPSSEVTIEVEGTFDGASAWKLRHALESVRVKTKRVVLDFSCVREFADFGISVLAYGLAERASNLPKVSLRGLRTHQMRLLKYLGVEAELM